MPASNSTQPVVNMEDEQPDSRVLELQLVVNALLPIRRQRLSRAERHWRETEQRLQHTEAALAQQQARLTQMKNDWQQQRAFFLHEALGKTQTLESLKNQLEQEQQQIRQIQAQVLLCTDWQQQCLHWRQQASDARDAVRVCQKAVEKLEYLFTTYQEAI
ncbi:type III secretion protein [Dickeya lacustris]|uniref:Type III secretion protein n=1 Tax=Dickeya lacustris TaxID=2259638 RepID=A0ABY8G8J6_9GAMM|nr:type III secretion protein [Dickeya lacustris]WFN56248.1 type III secretion protein [Dickeya lacustris]